MQPIPLVTGWNLLPFAQFLRGIGAPVERWLAESGIPPVVLDFPDRPVPLHFALDFGERAARAEGADSLGIDVGRHTAAECLGPFGAALARCPTLYDRIQSVCHLLSWVNNLESIRLELDGPQVALHSTLNCKDEPGLRHAEDFTLMLILEAVGRAAGPGWKPDAILLPGVRSLRFERDELFQGVKIRYGAKDVAVIFSRELLSRPLRQLPAGYARNLLPAAAQEAAPQATDLVGSLESTVMALLPIGCPTIAELADLADTTPRSLQRRLAGSGTSVREVIDRARFRLADEYLRDTSTSVTDIAFELGYGDSTAFTRAFHRMAGVAPSTYRQQRYCV